VRTGNAITSSRGASPGTFSLKGIDKVEVKIKRSTVGNRIFTRLKVTVTPQGFGRSRSFTDPDVPAMVEIFLGMTLQQVSFRAAGKNGHCMSSKHSATLQNSSASHL
jgi:hypothetical protein